MLCILYIYIYIYIYTVYIYIYVNCFACVCVATGTAKEGEVSCMVGSHTKTVLIYQSITLKWAAQLNSVPVALRVANFQWVPLLLQFASYWFQFE